MVRTNVLLTKQGNLASIVCFFFLATFQGGVQSLEANKWNSLFTNLTFFFPLFHTIQPSIPVKPNIQLITHSMSYNGLTYSIGGAAPVPFLNLLHRDYEAGGVTKLRVDVAKINRKLRRPLGWWCIYRQVWSCIHSQVSLAATFCTGHKGETLAVLDCLSTHRYWGVLRNDWPKTYCLGVPSVLLMLTKEQPRFLCVQT